MHKVDSEILEKKSRVYFIQQGENGPIKIGFTVNIRRRLTITQIYNPCLVFLLCVTDGGQKEEFELHRKFQEHRLYGEWFLPHEDILNYISQFKHLGYISEDFRCPPKRGSESSNWKGENVLLSSKRQRARAYTRWKRAEKCERCGLRKGLDLICVDGNRDNLSKDNFKLYCRRCRMETDGTLENLVNNTKKNAWKHRKPPRPCKICGKLNTRFWYGRCHTCSEYLRRHGVEHSEKPEKKLKKPAPCIVCGKFVLQLAKGKCHTCYEFFRRNGFEINEYPINKEVTNLELLKDGKNMSVEKVHILRDLYGTGDYEGTFLAKKANISKSSFYDIVRNVTWHDDDYIFVPRLSRRREKANHQTHDDRDS